MSLQRKLLVGSVWAVAMRWIVRLLGLLSIVVLARVLKPEDFGIFAMAMLVVGVLEAFAELGVTLMIIRESDVSRSDLDTAWTLRLLQALVLALLVIAMAYPATLYFREPRIVTVLLFVALAMVIGGFENVGVILIRKELDFAKDFRYQLMLKASNVIVTIALALLMKDYLALAIAQPIAAVISVFISYRMHPYRPRLGLKGWRRLLGFSTKMIAANVARFVSNKADVFAIARIGTPAQMGAYNVALELSSMPTRELTVSVGRAMFPTLAKSKQSGEDFIRMFLQVVGSVALLCVPIGAGIWAVADDIVQVFLGASWTGTGALMAVLVIYGTLNSLIDLMVGHVLIVTGHENRQTAILWIRSALLVVCVLGSMHLGVLAVAYGALISALVMFATSIVALTRTLSCTTGQLLGVMWRPVLAAVLMAALVRYLLPVIAGPDWIRLAISVGIGVASYVAAMAILWFASGRPLGVEQFIAEWFIKRGVPRG